jgi:hypothetical protein
MVSTMVFTSPASAASKPVTRRPFRRKIGLL